jgi:hypothetical protein
MPHNATPQRWIVVVQMWNEIFLTGRNEKMMVDTNTPMSKKQFFDDF